PLRHRLLSEHLDRSVARCCPHAPSPFIESLLLQSAGPLHDLHSFPTRRSSDLSAQAGLERINKRYLISAKAVLSDTDCFCGILMTHHVTEGRFSFTKNSKTG